MTGQNKIQGGRATDKGELMGNNRVIAEVKHMNKQFGSTIALNDVSITINKGEILGLIGENGSGKSTVTSILSGMQKADTGEMWYEGNRWEPVSMIEAMNRGIGMIVQETGTIPGVSVAENIFLGELSRFKTGPVIRRRNMYQEAAEILNNIGAEHIRPEMITGMLDLQDRKLIEIAKVMSKNPKLLIVDETTTALSQQGREIVYR